MLCSVLISYFTAAVEKYTFQVKKDQGKGERVRGCLTPMTQPLASLLALTHSVKEAAAVMLVGERWTRLSVVAGRDPKVKRREDDLVLRCEASLLLKRGKGRYKRMLKARALSNFKDF